MNARTLWLCCVDSVRGSHIVPVRFARVPAWNACGSAFAVNPHINIAFTQRILNMALASLIFPNDNDSTFMNK